VPVQDIHDKYLLNQSGRGRIVYIHCESGHDRTGEVSGSYSMRYQGESFEQVKETNTEIAHREINTINENEMMWYGYYLIYNLEFATVGPIQ
jgi:protein-tyrosine phosphatase